MLRSEFFNIWVNNHDNKNKCYTVIEYVMEKIGLSKQHKSVDYDKAKQVVYKLVLDLSEKWKSVTRSRKQFESKYVNWLNSDIVLLTNSEVPGTSEPKKDYFKKK